MKTRLLCSFLFSAFLNLYSATDVAAQQFNSSHEYDLNILQSFYQGHQGDYNCAAIAVIKCAMATFGVDNIFKSVVKNVDGFRVTLRNSEVVNITEEELRLATDSNGFLPSAKTSVIKSADMIYAVMVKRATGFRANSFAGCTSFNNSLIFLHGDPLNGSRGGVSAMELPQLIGLRSVPVAAKRNLAYVHGNGYHAVFSSQLVFDDYGTPTILNFYNFKSHIGKNPFKDLRSINFKVADI